MRDNTGRNYEICDGKSVNGAERAEEMEKRTLTIKNMNSDIVQKAIILGSLLIIFAVFTILSPNFLTLSNLSGILLATTVNGILSVGITYVMIGGGCDISVGTNMTLCGVMMAVFITRVHMPPVLGVVCGILIGTLVGAFNGFMIAKCKLPPFIQTLGMMMVCKGLTLVISGARPIYLDEVPGYQTVATGSFIQELFGINIPNGVFIMIAMALLASFLLNKTIFGRYMFAIGSNEESARLSGLDVVKWKLISYAVCGTMSGFAAWFMTARLNSAQPSTGSGYEMDAIAACIIGGASMNGGEGSVSGTIIGAFIMSVLINGLRIMSVPSEIQTVVTGSVVIFAVYLDTLRRKGE